MNNTFARVLGQISRILIHVSILAVPLFYLTRTAETVELPKQFLFAILTVLALVCWVGSAALERSFTLRRTPLDIPLLVLLFLALVSSIFARDRQLAFWGNYDNYTWSFLSLLFLVIFYFLVVQSVKNIKDVMRYVRTFAISVAVVDVIFLVHLWLPRTLTNWANIPNGNVVSVLSSSLGVMTILGFVVAATGLLIKRNGFERADALWGLLALLNLITLVGIGFKGVWFIAAVALFVVLVYAVSRAEDLRIPAIVGLFVLLVASIVLSFFGTPRRIVAPLPVEVSLAPGTSWGIVSSAITNDVKSFIVGSGPSTFVLDFSRFRPETFNNNFAWNVRFTQPYSSAFDVLGSLGILGAAALAVVLLITVGTLLMLWLRKPMPKARSRAVVAPVEGGAEQSVAVELSGDRGAWFWALASAWLTLLVTAFVLSFGTTLWFLFFFLLALVMVAAKLLTGDTKSIIRVSLKTSPQYTLATSFGFVLAFSAVIIFGIFLIRFLVGEVAYAKGLREIVRGNSEQAVREFTSAVSYNRDRARYHLALSQAYLAQANRNASSGQPDPNFITTLVAAAVNSSRTATELAPNDVNAWEFLANMYATARAISADANTWVISSLKRAIELERTNPRLHIFLANAQVTAGQTVEARKNYERAVTLKPGLVDAYLNLAVLDESENKIDDAISRAAQAILVAPQNTDALFTIGRLLYNRNKGDDRARAKIALQEVVRLNSAHANAHFLLGLIAESEGRPGEALSHYREVQKLNPDNADVRRKIQALSAPAPSP